MSGVSRKLRAFLCYASQDKPAVREVYQRLKEVDWIDPWLDEEKLDLGQPWKITIESALKSTDVVIIFLSQTSVRKEGFVQRELKYAWDISLEKPPETVFLIPLRLDDVTVPNPLDDKQWGNYFDEEKERTYHVLLRSLKSRHSEIEELEGVKHTSFGYEKNKKEISFIGKKYTWSVKQKLGEGYSGDTYLVQVESEPSIFGVLKTPSSLSVNRILQSSQIQKEGEILRALNGLRVNEWGYEVGVPKVLDYSSESLHPFFIVIEKAYGVNLTTILSNNPQVINKKMLFQIFSGILLFIVTIHKNRIIWNDLKVDHIFWDPDRRLVTIIDWANGQYLEIDSATRDQQFLLDNDYIQFVDIVGGILKRIDPNLYKELGWPDIKKWNGKPEAINSLKILLVEAIEQISEDNLQESSSDENGEAILLGSADVYKNADNAERLINEAEVLFYNGHYSDAVKKYDQVLSIDQYWERARNHRAQAVSYINRNRLPEAVLPPEVAVLFGKAQSAERLGHIKEAKKFISQAKEILKIIDFGYWAEGNEYESKLDELLKAEQLASEGVMLFNEGRVDEAIEKLDMAFFTSYIPKYQDIVERYKKFKQDCINISEILLMRRHDASAIVLAFEKLDLLNVTYGEHPYLVDLKNRLSSYVNLAANTFVREIDKLINSVEYAPTIEKAEEDANLAKSKIDQVVYLGVSNARIVHLHQNVIDLIYKLSDMKNSLIWAEEAYINQSFWPSKAWMISVEVRERFPLDPKVIELKRKLASYNIKTIILKISIFIAIILFLWLALK